MVLNGDYIASILDKISLKVVLVVEVAFHLLFLTSQKSEFQFKCILRGIGFLRSRKTDGIYGIGTLKCN